MDKQKKTHKVDEIRQVVARLFSEKGYHATSMREIGRALGMNQSSLYHYFKGKEEILYDLMNDTMDQGLAILKKICNADLSPEEKLSKVLSYYIRYYAGDPDRLTILANEMHALSENYRLVLTKKQRAYVHLIMSILNELSAQNKMKKIHPTIATFAFFGMVVHTIKWYHKGGMIGLEELTESFLEIFTQGVVADHLVAQE